MSGPEFAANRGDRRPIDMTLRSWSDNVPLAPIVATLGHKVDRLYVKGEPMASDGVLAGRLATRHYASIANAKGHDVADIADGLRQTCAEVASDKELVNLLRTGQVEALFWIAFFGRAPVPTPALDAALVRCIADLGARIFLENYTDLGPDCPTKVWLPDAPLPRPENRPA